MAKKLFKHLVAVPVKIKIVSASEGTSSKIVESTVRQHPLAR